MSKKRFNLALDEELYTWAQEFCNQNKTNVTAILTAYLVKMKRKHDNEKLFEDWMNKKIKIMSIDNKLKEADEVLLKEIMSVKVN